MSLVIKQSALQKREPDAQEEWVEYQPGIEFLIRGIAHRYVQIGVQAKRDYQAKIFARINVGDVSAFKQGKTEGEIGTEMVGELVVAGWSGLLLEGGGELPYSPESATAIFSSQEHQDLAIWVLAEATRISREAAERTKSRLGKSLPATGGNPSATS